MGTRAVTGCVAVGRVAAGLAFAAAPGWSGRLLVASDADAPGARLFIAAFGARDVLLGAGTLAGLARGSGGRAWLGACAAADAFDAVATLRSWDELPPGRRVLTFAVSAVPAMLGAELVRRLDG